MDATVNCVLVSRGFPTVSISEGWIFCGLWLGTKTSKIWKLFTAWLYFLIMPHLQSRLKLSRFLRYPEKVSKKQLCLDYAAHILDTRAAGIILTWKFLKWHTDTQRTWESLNRKVGPHLTMRMCRRVEALGTPPWQPFMLTRRNSSKRMNKDVTSFFQV